MLKKLLIALCVALAPVISMAAAKNTASTTTPINSIAAIVNSEVITTVELAKQQAFFAANLQASHTELPPEDVLRNQVLDQMIDQNLQLQIAKQNGIQVDDTDVTAAVKNIATKNGKTIAEMYASVRPMGLTPAAFRDEIRKELIINKLQEQQVASKITITPEEVADYLNSNAGQSLDTIEYHLGDILVTFPSGAPTAAQINETKQKAQDILANIKKGADFQTVAVANSKGDNALQGGDLAHQGAGNVLKPGVWRQKHRFNVGHQGAVHARELRFKIKISHRAHAAHHGAGTVAAGKFGDQPIKRQHLHIGPRLHHFGHGCQALVQAEHRLLVVRHGHRNNHLAKQASGAAN